jgi:hypothetical protein
MGCILSIACVPAALPGRFSLGRGALRCLATAAPVAAPAASSTPALPASAVERAHGFTLARAQYVKEYGSHVLLYKHDKTGAVTSGGLPKEARCGSVSVTCSQCIAHSDHGHGADAYFAAPRPPRPTGAELISVLNNDENKTFGVVFRT